MVTPLPTQPVRATVCMSLSRCPDGTLHCVALLGSGRAPRITVTAADTNGRTVSQSFRVRDQPRPLS